MVSAKETLIEMKDFKSVEVIIKSLQDKSDRPLSFDNNEKKVAKAFFNSNNYFSYSIYRKLLPRIEEKHYSFTDSLNLYNFNSFLRENLTQFTGHVELMLKATLIQQICTYYEKKKQEDKILVALNLVQQTIDIRKAELVKKITKICKKDVSVHKIINELEKKFSGSIKSIADMASMVGTKYSKEFAELLGNEAKNLILELVVQVQKKALFGISELANTAIELLAYELEKRNVYLEELHIQEVFMEKMHVTKNNLVTRMSNTSQEIIDNAMEWAPYNMFKFSTGECYLDLSIYKRESDEELQEALQIIQSFKGLIEIDSNKSEAIQHYKKKQSGVPIWVIMDEITYGTVYRFATGLNDELMNKWIGEAFDITLKDFVLGWFRAINFLRNACAHYTRLYGRYFNVSPPSLLKEDLRKAKITADSNKSLFANMLTLKNLLNYHIDGLEKWDIFINTLEKEIEKNSEIIRISEMGFPENWKECLTQ